MDINLQPVNAAQTSTAKPLPLSAPDHTHLTPEQLMKAMFVLEMVHKTLKEMQKSAHMFKEQNSN